MGFYHRVEVLTDEQRAQEWKKRHSGSTVRWKPGLLKTVMIVGLSEVFSCAFSACGIKSSKRRRIDSIFVRILNKNSASRRVAARQASTRLMCPRETPPKKVMNRADTVLTLSGDNPVCEGIVRCCDHRPEHARSPDSGPSSPFDPYEPRNSTTCYNAFEPGWNSTNCRPECPRSKGKFLP